MSAADGQITGTVKVVDHGPNGARYNIVIVGDGYRAAEMAKYHTDVQSFVTTLRNTAPFADLWCGINVHRVDVVSTDSGADDPATCADVSAGSGASPKTYFDSTFCGGGAIRRLLTCDDTLARTVAQAQVPEAHMTMVIVNSALYGGSGGSVATFSTHASATEIALHEMGHTAFGLADEYEYYAGCGSGETDRNHYVGGEPIEPNVTLDAEPEHDQVEDRCCTRRSTPCRRRATPIARNATRRAIPSPRATSARIRVRATTTAARFAHPTTAECARSARPSVAVCQGVIRDCLAPYLPAAYQGLWWNAPAASESGWGINLAHQGDTIFATWFTYDTAGKAWWLSMTAAKVAWNAYSGTLYETRGPAFNATPFNPALVTRTAVGTGTLTFADSSNGSFAYTVNGVTQTKAITRQVFGPLPVCTFGVQQDLAAATNYQDLWWAAPAVRNRGGASTSRTRATSSSRPGSPTTSTARHCGFRSPPTIRVRASIPARCI